MNWLSDKVMVSQDNNNNSYLFVVIFRRWFIASSSLIEWTQRIIQKITQMRNVSYRNECIMILIFSNVL
jgi:hypothetical protein